MQSRVFGGTNAPAGVFLNNNNIITRELGTEDVTKCNAFQNFLRMHPKLFGEILERITQPLYQYKPFVH